MTLSRMLGIAAVTVFIAAAPLLAGSSASAQTQPQGMTVGSPPPSPPGGKKAQRAKCRAEAKEKSLKGKALRSYMDTCMKG